jgi:hypothetical protein
MDAKEYDRIADLLMQIRKKYAKIEVKEGINIQMKQEALDYVNALLWLNDELGKNDAQGWL